MTIITDEDVPKAVGDFLTLRGHSVSASREMALLGQRRPDKEVAAAADANGAIVVTCNYKHFKQLIHRHPDGRNKFPRAGLITLHCLQPEARDRLAVHIEAIELEYSTVAANGDRLIVEVHAAALRIVR